MQVERVFIGVHVVEAHELESVGFDHLVAEDVHAVLLHQCERAFRIDILLVIASHVVDGRRESSQRIEFCRHECCLGVDEVTCNENDVRLAPIGFFNDFSSIASPVVAHVDVRELHRDDVAGQAGEGNLGLHNREPIGPQAADERGAGRQKQRRRTHAGFRQVPRPLNDVQEYDASVRKR